MNSFGDIRFSVQTSFNYLQGVATPLLNRPVQLISTVAFAVLFIACAITLARKFCARVLPNEPKIYKSIPDKPSRLSLHKEIKPGLMIIPSITITHICNPLSPEELDAVEAFHPTRFQALGSLSILPNEVLLHIYDYLGEAYRNSCKGMRELYYLERNSFAGSKGRVERQFQKTISEGRIDEAEQLMQQMQARWGENFERRFYNLELDLEYGEIFVKLLKLAQRPTLPREHKHILLFKMIEMRLEAKYGRMLQMDSDF